MRLAPALIEQAHARELAAISGIRDRRGEAADLVFRDLPRGRVTPKIGRPAMSAEQVLRADSVSFRRVTAKTWEARVEDGKKVRFDCRVTEANIHEPIDNVLSWDVVRVLTRLMRRSRVEFGDGIQFTDHSRMLRVFKVDVLECPQCKGRLKIIATVTTPSAVKAILECLGLPARPPPSTTVLRTRRASRSAAAREREQEELGVDG